MALPIRKKGDRGFTSSSGVSTFTAASRVFHFRASGAIADGLEAMAKNDRCDFIRAAIAEKLERSKQEI